MVKSSVSSERPDRDGFRMLRIATLAAMVGVLVGFVAYGLYSLIGFVSNLVFYQRVGFNIPDLTDHTLGLYVLVVPALGGIIVGLMARFGSDKIRGHGIPEAMEAVLVQRSRIAPKVAILKPVSAAISIGTGGPFGAEGPIIQTGGAIGSIVGQILNTTPSERKVLLAAGAAAGMAAMFGTPIAAVIMAIELLLFEFRSRSFIPLVIASTLATTVHNMIMGNGPMIAIGSVDFSVPGALPFYIFFGLIAGVGAIGVSKLLYLVEDWFEMLPFDKSWWPAIGGIGLGIIGLFFPRVLGVGYGTISSILNGQLPLLILLSVVLFKTLAMVMTLGSGASGGLLAPMLMIGAAIGGAFAMAVNAIIPEAHLVPGAFALVGMAALFGAASRSTFAFIIFGFEITQDYNAILPLMIVAVVADLIALRWMKNSIMTEKLARRGLSVNQEFEVDHLMKVQVGDVMDDDVPTIPSTMLASELADRIASGDPDLLRHQGILIVDENDELAGIITRGDLIQLLDIERGVDGSVLDYGTDELITVFPDEYLDVAVARMLYNDIGRLPVVSRENPRKVIGYIGRRAVLESRRHRISEDDRREDGWLPSRPTWAQRPRMRRKPNDGANRGSG